MCTLNSLFDWHSTSTCFLYYKALKAGFTGDTAKQAHVLFMYSKKKKKQFKNNHKN